MFLIFAFALIFTSEAGDGVPGCLHSPAAESEI